jgi:hypothetical protein
VFSPAVMLASTWWRKRMKGLLVLVSLFLDLLSSSSGIAAVVLEIVQVV